MEKSQKIALGILTGIGLGAVAWYLLKKKPIYDEDIVQDLDLKRFMGEWYEIARMPAFFEKNLRDVREDYRMNNDQRSFTTITTAYDIKKGNIFSVKGIIYRPKGEIGGRLCVSYLRPVWFDYLVFDIDPGYQYAMVGTSSLNYLWILSRTRTIPSEIRMRFLRKATTMGFKTSRLIWY